MCRGIPYLALSEGLDTHETVAVPTGGCRAAFGLGLFLLLSLTGDVEDVLSSLKSHEFQCGLDFAARHVDDISLVHEVNADLLGLSTNLSVLMVMLGRKASISPQSPPLPSCKRWMSTLVERSKTALTSAEDTFVSSVTSSINSSNLASEWRCIAGYQPGLTHNTHEISYSSRSNNCIGGSLASNICTLGVDLPSFALSRCKMKRSILASSSMFLAASPACLLQPASPRYTSSM